ncbi:DUF4234 domain-containing protein [Butyrivibrio sp. AE3004]|uniref:DUF4234 domain-containing protein n=1 Tax=Butyrivibrio sp. AE3004 TaxID=1506994 RepID=UPI0009DDA9ED|nr:DUF4234 domain-containing protein [Butyrivibrio sp. AE3004]
MICPNCGAENPDSTNFCTNCGTRLVQDSNQGQAPQDGPVGFNPNNGNAYGNNQNFNYQNGNPGNFQQPPYLAAAGITGRSIALAIILSIVTCGIYNIYWFIVLTDETNVLCNRQHETSGVLAFLLTIVTCGIYGWFWAYKLGEKVDQIRGEQSASNSILFIILQIIGLGIVAEAIAQDTVNKAVRFQ